LTIKLCSYRGSHQFLYDVHVDKKNPVLSLMIGRISGIVGVVVISEQTTIELLSKKYFVPRNSCRYGVLDVISEWS